MLIPVVYPPHAPAPPPQFSPPPPPEQPEGPGAPPPEPPPPADTTPPGDVPWALYLLRALWLCAFPVGIVVAGVGFLLGVAQANEALLALEVFSWQAVALLVAFKLWLLLAWYTCRLLLDRRFSPDTLGECRRPRFAEGLRRWLPRALIAIGGLPISIFFLLQSRERLIGVLLLVITAGLALFVWKRRDWLLKLDDGSWLARCLALGARRDTIAAMAREDRLTTPSRVLVALVLLLQWAVFALLLAWPEATARSLGSPALMLLAMGSWIVFGGIVLTYIPKAVIRIPLTPLPLVLLLLCAPFNDNHRVADPQRSAASDNLPRQAADAWLAAWMRTAGADAKRPLVLVAVAGGASRAAYWGTASLSRLMELGEQEGVNFADSVFTVSGTSGGALAAASFVAALDARRQAVDPASCTPWKLLRDFTGQDHLATPVGYLLYPDLMQRMLPFTFPSADRSLGLEGVWTRDWPRSLARQCPTRDAKLGNPWSQPFTALHARATEAQWLPLLALNTTALNRGQRVYQADYPMPSADGIDLMDPTLGLDVNRLTLAQAVHNSARFPYISPAGAVRFVEAHHDAENDDVGATWDRLGDGGYVEASATLALLDLLRDWEAAGKLRDCRADEDCAGQGILDRHRLRLLLLGNTPARIDDWLCRDAPRAENAQPADAQRYRATAMGLDEVLAPPSGILASNGARGRDSQLELIKRIGGCNRVAELRLPRHQALREPSMNWMLNAASRAQIDAALQGQLKTEDPWAAPAQAQLMLQMRQAQRWMQLMK
jgi:hypothetical protein